MKEIVSIIAAILLAAAPVQEPPARVEIRLDCALGAGGGLSGELAILAYGAARDDLLDWLAALPPVDRRWAAGLFLEHVVPGAELLTGEMRNEETPLGFSCRFRSARFTIAGSGRILVPAILGKGVIAVAGVDSLFAPDSQNPIELSLEEIVRLPVGYTLSPTSRITEAGEGASSFSASLDAQSVAVSRKAVLRLGADGGREDALRALKHWHADVVAERQAR